MKTLLLLFCLAVQSIPQLVVVSVDRANLRDKPTATGSTIVVTLDRGAELDVLEVSGTWYRVRVRSTGRVGYVSNTLVQPVTRSTPATPTPATPAPPRVDVPPPAAGTPAPPRAPRPVAPPVAPPPASPVATPVASPRKIGGRVYAAYDIEKMGAVKSFEAIFGAGKATMKSVGFGAEATNLWKGAFARFAYSSSSMTGSRVYLDDSLGVHTLNIPLTVTIAPMEIGAGWRFRSFNAGAGVSVGPDAGASLLMQKYTETSSFAAPDENVTATDKGQAFFGGVEVGVRRVKYLRVGLEGQYRSVPSALGLGGVSQAFNETSLGGSVFRVWAGIGF